MKKRFLISTVAASILLSSSVLFASSNLNDSVALKESKALNNPLSVVGTKKAKAEVEEANSKELFLTKEAEFKHKFQNEAKQDDLNRLKKVVNKEALVHKQNLKKAPKEVLHGVEQILIAIKAINTNNIADAKKALNSATNFFNQAFKVNPKLELVPVSDNIQIVDFDGDSKLIKHLKKTSIKLLRNNDMQEAREILLPLQDEIIMTTKLIPMDIYPDATKQALKYLKLGKKESAFSTLIEALDTTVVNTIIIPIPLITAQDMVLEASKLNKSHKKDALKLLSTAQDELKKAILLGYTQKYSEDYKTINAQIEKTEKALGNGSITSKLYNDVDNFFHKTINKYHTDIKK